MQPGSIEEFMSLVLAALLGLAVRLLQVHLFPKIAQGRFDIVTRDVAMRCRKVILDRRLWPCSGLCFNPVLLFTSLSLSRSWSLSLRLSLSLSLSLSLALSLNLYLCFWSDCEKAAFVPAALADTLPPPCLQNYCRQKMSAKSDTNCLSLLQ
jgi:hypothetical protein